MKINIFTSLILFSLLKTGFVDAGGKFTLVIFDSSCGNLPLGYWDNVNLGIDVPTGGDITTGVDNNVGVVYPGGAP